MVRVDYLLGQKAALHKVIQPPFRLLALNNKPSIFFLPVGNRSRYDGFFVNLNGEIVKVIDGFKPEVGGEVLQVRHYGYKFEVVRNQAAEEFFVPPNTNTLVYRSVGSFNTKLILDVKKIFDNGEWGRNYRIISSAPRTLIEFQKPPLKVYIAVNTPLRVSELWEELELGQDLQRNSPPYNRYVYSPGWLSAPVIVVTAAETPNQAEEENIRVERELSRLDLAAANRFQLTFKELDAPAEVEAAYNLSRYYLSQLATGQGILAGLPWFAEVWSRDELISLKAVMLEGREDFVRRRLQAYLRLLGQSGKLPSKLSNPSVLNDDSAGWLCKRWMDYYSALTQHFGRQRLGSREASQLLEALKPMADRVAAELNTGPGASSKGGTWMDSLEREGQRVEIAALNYAALELLRLLSKDTHYLKLETQYAARFRKDFLAKPLLKDSPSDGMLRPNLFLAGYAAPKLLRKEEWIACFRRGIKGLWNTWGGFATVEKSSPLFQKNHTGENPASYHNGDSWFFLNNLAALTMLRLRSPEFRGYISRILKGSTEETLWMGCLGCHGELSPSGQLQSAGAWLQAWSCASYIELVHALYLENNTE